MTKNFALKRLLLLMGVSFLIFVAMNVRGFFAFRTYQQTTLAAWKNGMPPWRHSTFTVEACHQWAFDWQQACDGLPTLCVQHSERLFHACLISHDRNDYCPTHTTGVVGREIYTRCQDLTSHVHSTQLGRAKARTQCNAFSRVINDVCRTTPPSFGPAS